MIKRLSEFWRDERGSTIEFVLWIPLFGVLLIVTTDVAFMYMTMTRMENAARDGARRMSTGDLDGDTVSNFVLSQLGGPTPWYTVDAGCTTPGTACVDVSRLVDSIVISGLLTQVVGDTFTARVSMRAEPGETMCAPGDCT